MTALSKRGIYQEFLKTEETPLRDFAQACVNDSDSYASISLSLPLSRSFSLLPLLSLSLSCM